ncbi:Crp/Fnr family transcriptional regulator [Anaerobacillus alkaliphilus]|uniref:Crp/Fnr family transcriptional regulator n=1 Tax=Anaerobacillus alkaliphilus TaxID=1548597 RepID=A0A4Q0VQT0_9BACI|nr:Crp/Fnr family transcriptional regulator [Anaerobacillus alkaliphilus]RXI98277.1 Crp/Fnr family transcriptional regulator [Anaerobacillus alkaliphilus]
MTRTRFLDNIPIFSSLPNEQKEQLIEIVQTKKMTKGEVLFQEFDPAEAIYFINEGKVRINKSTPDGKEIALTIRQTGDMFAEVALFAKVGSTYPATAICIEGGYVSFIKNNELETFLLQHPQLAISMFRFVSERLRISQATLRDVALYGKFGALAATLVRLAEEYGVTESDGLKIKIKLTHEDLGSFFGATRESVTRLMNQLKQQKIVTKKQGYLIIHNLDLLKEYIN